MPLLSPRLGSATSRKAVCQFLLVFGVFGAASQGIGTLYAQDAGDGVPAIFELIGGRQRLLTGEFTAVEWKWKGKEADPDDQFARNEIFCAFDDWNDRFRFDRNRKVRVTEWPDDVPGRAPQGNPKRPVGPFKIEDSEAKYIRLTDQSIHWTSAHIYEVAIHPREQALRPAMPFHVKSIGLATTGDLLKFPELRPLLNIFRNQKLEAVETQQDGLQRLTWRFGEGKVVRHLWLDPKQDYVPVRMEVREAPRADENDDSPLIVAITTEWKRIGNVYVPTKSTHLERRGAEQVKAYEIELTWKRVNQELPDDLFTPGGFEVPRFARIVDKRFEPPAVVGKIIHIGP